MVKLSEKDAAALLGHKGRVKNRFLKPSEVGKGYRRRHKFNATRVEVDGIWFDSKREAAHYGELLLLQRAGVVGDIELQPEYDLVVPRASGGWVKVGVYRADFRYRLTEGRGEVVSDVKGFRTALYRWKKRHVEAQYGIQIVEV